MIRIALCVLILALAGSAPARTQTPPEAARIGYLSLDADPRRERAFVYARIRLFPPVEPVDGARMAIEDMAPVAEVVGRELSLDVRSAADGAGLAAAARAMAAEGIGFIVLDLPGPQVEALAQALEGEAITLVNATARDDALRTACHANLLHASASDKMIADAMAQYLRSEDWTDVTMLVGKTDEDARRAAAFAASAERLRLEIRDRQAFDLSTNPELRDQNNIKLLTSGRRYDVVWISDVDGEFGRYVPYQTSLPRPVVGTHGLIAQEWHWSLERYGAPQVNQRFYELAGRRMDWQDWSTWIATRAVATALTRSPDAGAAAEMLRSERFRVDGSKGTAQSFRGWNGQLRMPILLTTSDAVIEVAPLEGFLHQVNTLDTLGTDAPEFACD